MILFPQRARKSPITFKPSLCLLEDRTVPSTFSTWWNNWQPPTPGPATHLQVDAPHNVKVGQAFAIEVDAKDANNRIATGYLGTVHFTLGTADANALLPADYTFTAADKGRHFFTLTLAATGNQIITATDTATSSITGNAATYVYPAPAATHFAILSPGYVTVGVPVTVSVVALDSHNHIATGYTGTVAFTSSDPNASLPGNYTFVIGDHGQHTFQVTYAATGKQTFVATDTTTASITGQASPTVEAVGSVTHFGLFTLGFAIPGVPTAAAIVALDAQNHVVAGYTGTVHFTSSDGAAVLPGDYTFLATDNGRHIVSVTFNTIGIQTLTATDTVAASITATTHVRVKKLGWGWWGW